MGRWIRFIIAICIGLAGGIGYGWLLHPADNPTTEIATLRVDYRSDYVLMIAEAFQADHNLTLAIQRLAALGEDYPADTVQSAILFAEKQGYSDIDLNLLRGLFLAVQENQPSSGGNP